MAAVVTIVLPAKLNLPVVQPEQPVVRDSNSMGVPCDVLEDLLRSGERWLGVDLPIYFFGGRDVAQEGVSRPEWFQGGKDDGIAASTQEWAGRTSAGRKSTACHQGKCLHREPRNADGDGGEEPVPRYGAPRRIRSARPDAWGRPQ